jgi:transposase
MSESSKPSVLALVEGQRWSPARKKEVVLRILRGESLDSLSRELALDIAKLQEWRDRALSGLDASLRERNHSEPLQVELDKALRRVGELSMENELLKTERKAPPFAYKKSKK